MAGIPSIVEKTISTEAAGRCVAAALEAAGAMGVPVSVAVLDASGQLKAFARMDGSPLLSISTSQRKAYTAAAIGRPTKTLYDAFSSDPALLGLIGGLPGLAVIPGGVTIRDGETVIGAVGVSGATGEQDTTIAESAAAKVGA